MVAVSLALAVQALMFGDGGVTTFGANCLNMAVIMPFAGWAAYRVIAGNAPVDSRRQLIGAAAGGYIGLNAAALSAGLMFGIQPLIAHDAAGRALYCPFGLQLALPAMCATHLVLFGVVEAVVTGLVIAYFQRVEPSLLPLPKAHPSVTAFPVHAGGLCDMLPRIHSKDERRAGVRARRFGLVIAAMILLSPLGLYLPARFGAGSAWGEWSSHEIAKLAGYMPSGLRHMDSIWNAPMPDYAPKPMAYLFVAVVGVALVMLVTFALGKLIWRKNAEADTSVDASADHS
jgi:cobalt/nickel transport system permease protein